MGQGIAGIEDQIEQGAFQLVGIGERLLESGVQLELQDDIAAQTA